MALRQNRNAFINIASRNGRLLWINPGPAPDPPIVARIDTLARVVAGDGPQSGPIGARAAVDRAFARAVSRSVGGLSLTRATAALPAGLSATADMPSRPVNAGRAGAVTPDPARAVLIDSAVPAIARARRAAAGLQNALSANAREVAALAGSVIDVLDGLRVEFDRGGEPRTPYVLDLLQRLNAPPPAPAFGLVNDIDVLLTSVVGPPRFPPDPDSFEHTSYQVLLDATNALWTAWIGYQTAAAVPAAGTTQALAYNLHAAADYLRIIATRTQDLRGSLHAVYVNDADRARFPLNAPAFLVAGPIPILHFADLLGIISEFATVRGPKLLDQGDQTGLGEVQDEADAIFDWTDQLLLDIRLNPAANPVFLPLFDNRVDRPLYELHARLNDLASL